MKKKSHAQNNVIRKITWEKYEDKVYDACKIGFPHSVVTKNEKIRGRLSGRSRQIDILIKETIGGNEISIVVDCKLYSSKADIKDVEGFIGMLADIGADRGIMISEKGYTESALKRAYNNPLHLELDIYSLSEVRDKFHGELAIPRAGGYAALLVAPLGWIVDANKRPNMICMLYQRGLTMEEAAEERELAYINFWIKDVPGFGLQELLNQQEASMSANRIVNYINYLDSISRNDAVTKLRIADIQGYPAIEITGFVEFEGFIFFCTWFSREVNLKRNIRKLESIMMSIIPMTVRNEETGQ